MLEKLTIAFFGAAIALSLKSIVETYLSYHRRLKLAKFCAVHMRQIREDLQSHVQVSNGQAHVGETQFCETSVGDFLYDLIVSNIDNLRSVESINATMTFFHHYKVNMATVKARLARSDGRSVSLTEGTYNNLLARLDAAIAELEGIGHILRR